MSGYLRVDDTIIDLANVAYYVKEGPFLEIHFVGDSKGIKVLARSEDGKSRLQWFDLLGDALQDTTQ
jgi:hypothetical protein